MKYVSALFVFAALQACGPAAENRDLMHARAKVFQDSIANMIRIQMSEAMGPEALKIPRPDNPTTQATPSAQPQ